MKVICKKARDPEHVCHIIDCFHSEEHGMGTNCVSGAKFGGCKYRQCVPAKPEYVKVMRCSEDRLWYRELLGRTLEVFGDFGGGYKVRDLKGRTGGIFKRDCEPCESPEKNPEFLSPSDLDANLGTAIRYNHDKHVKLHAEYGERLWQAFLKNALKTEKETPMKYKQLKPISLADLWHAQDDTGADGFMEEWALFMNWISADFESLKWTKLWGHDVTADIILLMETGDSHGHTWLKYMEKHGFIEKVFEPFDVVLRVEHKESAVSLLVDKIRIPSGSFWGMDIRDQLKAHGFEP